MLADNKLDINHEKSRKPSFLEVEGQEERQRRLEKTFRRLNADSPSVHSAPSFNLAETGEFQPSTDLLARVQAFLPQIEAANAMLAEQDPETVDIENLGDGQGHYIEMNLGLGVFEDTSAKDTDTDMQDASSSDSSSDNSSDSEDGYSTDQSSIIITCYNPGRRPIKPLPRRASTQPKIVVLDDGKNDSSSSSSPSP